jgi:nitrite reductase/ring-hydroxylating ferredoxin subunit
VAACWQLFTGTLRDHAIVCPGHGWSFDIRTGRFLAALELGMPVYTTRFEHGKVYVDLEGGGMPR